MTEDQIMTVLKEGLMVALKLSAPMLIVSIIVGLVVAIFQAATQIQEQTLTFVPKVLFIALILLILGSWMSNTLMEYMRYLFGIMQNFGGTV